MEGAEEGEGCVGEEVGGDDGGEEGEEEVRVGDDGGIVGRLGKFVGLLVGLCVV